MLYPFCYLFCLFKISYGHGGLSLLFLYCFCHKYHLAGVRYAKNDCWKDYTVIRAEEVKPRVVPSANRLLLSINRRELFFPWWRNYLRQHMEGNWAKVDFFKFQRRHKICDQAPRSSDTFLYLPEWNSTSSCVMEILLKDRLESSPHLLVGSDGFYTTVLVPLHENNNFIFPGVRFGLKLHIFLIFKKFLTSYILSMH